MHQKVQIHSVFLIHKKLQFVNASLGGNKMSMFAYKIRTQMPQEDQQGHLQLQIDCPFYCMTLCLIR